MKLSFTQLAIALLTFMSITTYGQSVSINDNAAAANTNSILDVDISTNDKGILIPRLTQAEIASMSGSYAATEDGMLVFNTDAKTFQYYVNGTGWVETGGASKTTAPAAGTDDITLGYVVGSIWHDTTNDNAYICLDNTDGAAVWNIITFQGATFLRDADGNTQIQTEESANENIIRFDLNGTERWVMNGARLEPVNSGNSVYIGTNAGAVSNLSNNNNVGIGSNTLDASTTGNNNVAVGYNTLTALTTVFGNVAIGSEAGRFVNQNNNTAIGFQSMYTNTVSGTENVAAGSYTLYNLSTGNYNTALGARAGQNITTGSSNTAVGNKALDANVGGTNNVAMGFDALGALTAGGGNTGLGYRAGYNNASGNFNTAIGNEAMGFGVTTGAHNVALGPASLNRVTSGNNNIALGSFAGQAMTTASNNVAVGYQALDANVSGTNNVAMGYDALGALTAGGGNTGLGYRAGYNNASGNFNTAIGNEAMGFGVTTGAHNVALGPASLNQVTSGNNNIALGSFAGNVMTTGSNNTALGYQALDANVSSSQNVAMGSGSLGATTGGNNTGLGHNAGLSNTTGSSNTFVGYQANTNAAGYTNATALGANAVVGQSNALILGSSADVGIGTSTPSAKLDVVGTTELNGDVDILTSAVDGFSVDGTTFSVDGLNNKVGIGTATPSLDAKLTIGTPGATFAGYGIISDSRIAVVNGSGNRAAMILESAGTYGLLDAYDYAGNVYMDIAIAPLVNTGNVGIGTAAPAHKLDVVGTAGLSTGTAWTNTSDIRLKDVQGNYNKGLKEIMALRTITFNYKKDNPLNLPSDKTIVGFVAQEVEKVIPDAVSEDAAGYKKLNVDPIHWAAINAIQEQQVIIEKQQALIDALEKRLSALEKK